jgi:hypothetical protein
MDIFKAKPLQPTTIAAKNKDISSRAFSPRETLSKSKFVIPAKAGIQKNQRTGFRLSPECRLINISLRGDPREKPENQVSRRARRG